MQNAIYWQDDHQIYQVIYKLIVEYNKDYMYNNRCSFEFPTFFNSTFVIRRSVVVNVGQVAQNVCPREISAGREENLAG